MRTKVRLLFDWFQENLGAGTDCPASIAKLGASVLGLDSATEDVHFLQKTPASPGCGQPTYPERWSPFSVSLARSIDSLLQPATGGTPSSLIVLSIEDVPKHQLGEQGWLEGTLAGDNLYPGLYWVKWPSQPAPSFHYMPAGDVRRGLGDYWTKLLSECWAPFHHGGRSDLTNEGLGCIRALATEKIGPGPLSSEAWNQLAGALNAPADEPPAELQRWRACISSLMETVYPLARAMGGNEMSPQLRYELSTRVPCLAPSDDGRPLSGILEMLDSVVGNRGNCTNELPNTIDRLLAISSALGRSLPRGDKRCIRDGETTAARAELAQLGNRIDGRRVLIVDDTPEPWLPLFRLMAAHLGVALDFSLDGEQIIGSTRDAELSLFSRLHYYGAVVVDIRLNDSSTDTGLAVAQTIRERRPSLPVIIWSSTDDPSVLAGLRLANGFVLKKTLSLTGHDGFFPLLEQALEQHRVHATAELLNVGFDQVIRCEFLRRACDCVAQEAMDWLAAFQALDDRYFRFFSDHGIKHSIHVLDNLRALFESIFPGAEEHDLARGSNGPERLVSNDGSCLTQWGIALLYAAAFAHDMGMFPDKSDVESWAEQPREDLERRRKFHAFHSAEWVENRESRFTGQLLNDARASAFLKDLRLVCLSHWEGISPDSVCSLRTIADYVSGDAPPKDRMDELANGLTPKRVWELVKLGKLLALADAFDCDYRRVPPEFVRVDLNARPSDYHHWLSHMAVGRCDISRGTITLSLAHCPEACAGPQSGEDAFEHLEIAFLDYANWYNTKSSRECVSKVASAYAVQKLVDELAVFRAVMNGDGLMERWEFAQLLRPRENGNKLPSSLELSLDTQAATLLGSFIDELHPSKRVDSSVAEKMQSIQCEPDDVVLVSSMFGSTAPAHAGKIRELGGGYSGSRVYVVTGPSDTPAQQPRVVKTDEVHAIEEELRRYRKLAAMHVPAIHLIGDADFFEFRGRGAYVGALVGGVGGADTLRKLQASHPDLVPIAIRRLLEEVLLCGRQVISDANTLATRFPATGPSAERWCEALNRATKNANNHPEPRYPCDFLCRLDHICAQLVGSGNKLPDTVCEAIKVQAIIHGDLNWQNVLVTIDGSEPASQTVRDLYLIDFQKFGPGMQLLDHAKLETDLLLHVCPPCTMDDVEGRIGFLKNESEVESDGTSAPAWLGAWNAIRADADCFNGMPTFNPFGHGPALGTVLHTALLHHYLENLSFPPEKGIDGRPEETNTTCLRMSLALSMVEHYASLLTDGNGV